MILLVIAGVIIFLVSNYLGYKLRQAARNYRLSVMECERILREVSALPNKSSELGEKTTQQP